MALAGPLFQETLPGDISMQFASLATTTLSFLLLAGPPSIAIAQDRDAFNLTTKQRSLHDRAVGAFRDGRYSAAYGRFVELADAGHVPSAQ
jgi:hypothetical protein